MRKNIDKVIADLVLDDGYTCYQSLPDDIKASLTAEMMTHADDTSFFEPLTESKKSEDNVFALIVYLRNGNLDSANHLAETLRDNAVSYFERRLEEKFDEIYSDVEHERKTEAGLHPIVDSVNGEVRWVR
jgi:hypothetical protein